MNVNEYRGILINLFMKINLKQTSREKKSNIFLSLNQFFDEFFLFLFFSIKFTQLT